LKNLLEKNFKFEKQPPASLKEAAVKIEELTGIKRSTTQVRNFLDRNAF